jgi:hypothetical protein
MHGQVTLLGRSSDPTNRTVEVWVTLGNEDGKLRANGAAQVTVSANSKDDADRGSNISRNTRNK